MNYANGCKLSGSFSLFFLSSQLQLQKHRHSFTKIQPQRHPTRLDLLLRHLPVAYAWRLAYLCYSQGYDHR